MRWSECCIIHLILYGIIQYYTAQSAKIPIIQTYTNVTPSLISQNPRERITLLVVTCLSHISQIFDITSFHQIFQITHSHASRHWHHYHYSNVDFVLFHNIPCDTDSLLSCIHANFAHLFNTRCTLVATGVILGEVRVYNVCLWILFFIFYFSSSHASHELVAMKSYLLFLDTKRCTHSIIMHPC